MFCEKSCEEALREMEDLHFKWRLPELHLDGQTMKVVNRCQPTKREEFSSFNASSAESISIMTLNELARFAASTNAQSAKAVIVHSMSVNGELPKRYSIVFRIGWAHRTARIGSGGWILGRLDASFEPPFEELSAQSQGFSPGYEPSAPKALRVKPGYPTPLEFRSLRLRLEDSH